MEKLKISRVIVVEGKYDKIKLSSIVDGMIVVTDGFGIFKDKEKKALLGLLAEKRGLIVLSDSDSAGRIIRNHLYSFIPKDKIIDLYIPQIEGKERRKDAPSKEGTLGVEGMESALLRDLLAPYADGNGEPGKSGERAEITKMTLYNDGFVGAPDSAARREKLLAALGLPKSMSTGALIRAINLLGGEELYDSVKDSLKDNLQ